MKFYSDKLNKMFDTEKACSEAEKEYDLQKAEAETKKKALAAERASRAKEIDALRDEVVKAQKAYTEKLREFVKDYGSYHNTYTYKDNDNFFNLFNLLDWF